MHFKADMDHQRALRTSYPAIRAFNATVEPTAIPANSPHWNKEHNTQLTTFRVIMDLLPNQTNPFPLNHEEKQKGIVGRCRQLELKRSLTCFIPLVYPSQQPPLQTWGWRWWWFLAPATVGWSLQGMWKLGVWALEARAKRTMRIWRPHTETLCRLAPESKPGLTLKTISYN